MVKVFDEILSSLYELDIGGANMLLIPVYTLLAWFIRQRRLACLVDSETYILDDTEDQLRSFSFYCA